MSRVTVHYHGTRAALEPGHLIEPRTTQAAGGQAGAAVVFLATRIDEAIWDAELADDTAPPRVYVVEPLGPVESADVSVRPSPGRPSMSLMSRCPLRVVEEVTEWPLYHGTRADLKPGDLIRTGHRPNYGNLERTTTYVYLSRTLDAAAWGAELASGDGPERVYIVEPTGPIEDDPNVTNRRFRGNPTKSFRSRDPLRVRGEVLDWPRHAPQALQAMKDHLARLAQSGIEPLD
ncbi:MAG: NAD(+)--rifampin ADP-ribosyltransferase [Vicinamibacterales bacterium]